jgi:ABC-type sugar transport system ATPase subunit
MRCSAKMVPGKSTLIKTIAGVYRIRCGRALRRRPAGRHPQSRTTRRRSASAPSFQEFTLRARHDRCGNTSSLGREPLRIRALSIVDRKEVVRRTRDVLASLDLAASIPKRTVRDLGVRAAADGRDSRRRCRSTRG